MSEPHEFDLFELQGKILHLQAEIDRLRADVRHLREAMQSVAFHAGDKTGDKGRRLILCDDIARDTLRRVSA